jgi:glutaredoxin 3
MYQEEIVIYARARSRSCRRARRLLERRGYAFEEVDIEGDEGLRVGLIESTGRTTVPLVFLGGRLVGSLGEIQALEHSGDLDRLVRAGCRRSTFVWDHATER